MYETPIYPYLGNVEVEIVFIEAGKYKFGCEYKGKDIRYTSECKHAALKLGKTFADSESVDGYPAGCYVYNDQHVYMNHFPTSNRNKNSSPICKIEGIIWNKWS